jgi:hypothetical protein
MGFYTRLLVRFTACSCVVAFACSGAWAERSQDRTQFGHDISISSGEEATELTCFGCNVHVRGHVTSDVTTFGGNIVLEDEGEIAGDVTAFGGNVRLDKGTRVGGDLTLFGGRMRRDPQAEIKGEVSLFSGSLWLLLVFGLPLLMLGAFVALIVWLVRLMTRNHVPAAAQRVA